VLLRAFIATLEELEDAHLLLHLVDVSSPDFEEKVEAVDRILESLDLHEKKKLLVFNKIDRIERNFLENLENRYGAVSISALKGIGVDGLIAAIEERIAEERDRSDDLWQTGPHSSVNPPVDQPHARSANRGNPAPRRRKGGTKEDL
jgi:50S ribosomal subunit-associated GTPase HflX